MRLNIKSPQTPSTCGKDWRLTFKLRQLDARSGGRKLLQKNFPQLSKCNLDVGELQHNVFQAISDAPRRGLMQLAQVSDPLPKHGLGHVDVPFQCQTAPHEQWRYKNFKDQHEMISKD